MNDLFATEEDLSYQPLAARMRPRKLSEYIGQDHLLATDKPLRKSIDAGRIHSMILWGPPGVGKTTLARLMAQYIDAQFLTVSAVLAGVKEIRESVEQAKQARYQGRSTILFVDEVHRFNKSQQDAFLPYVEDGTFVFIGATTENPSFELNNALLSRARVYVLKDLDRQQIEQLISSALENSERGLGETGLSITESATTAVCHAADGDARRALNLLEVASELALAEGSEQIDDRILEQALGHSLRRFDKGGDLFYEQISALHKAVRGSSPDGALYWFARMLEAGVDPLYVARRVVRMASEDIGNADPRALQIALNAWDVQDRLGSPEGELAIAQAVVYMASAPKSNAVYQAFNQVMSDIRKQTSHDVPMHLRNAPTGMMKSQGYGEDYRYAHDYPEAYAAGENYLPEALAGSHWYEPVPRGLELKIVEKLKYLRQLDNGSDWQRYPGGEEIMSLTVQQLIWVAIGGGCGAMARFAISAWVNSQTTSSFPWGTYAVNFLGSCLFGVLFVVVFANQPHREMLRLLLMVGFLGAFTTFSTFSFETVRLMETGQWWLAAANIVASVASCVMGAWIGMGAARMIS